MSSLAAARADNFYYDPAAFDPAKRGRGSANALAGSHPLGARAKRIGEGILVVRFELPYDSWCGGCGRHVARGVRFNADKRRVGAHHTSTIWEFTMPCPSACGAQFVIRTNPATADYDYVAGVRRKVKTFSAADAETLRADSGLVKASLGSHALFRVEHEADDRRVARSREGRLVALEALQAARWADDGAANAALRVTARAGRAAAAAAVAAGAARGYDFPLLPPAPSDAATAAVVMAAAATAAAAAGAADGLPPRLHADTVAALVGTEVDIFGDGGGGGGGAVHAATVEDSDGDTDDSETDAGSDADGAAGERRAVRRTHAAAAAASAAAASARSTTRAMPPSLPLPGFVSGGVLGGSSSAARRAATQSVISGTAGTVASGGSGGSKSVKRARQQADAVERAVRLRADGVVDVGRLALRAGAAAPPPPPSATGDKRLLHVLSRTLGGAASPSSSPLPPPPPPPPPRTSLPLPVTRPRVATDLLLGAVARGAKATAPTAMPASRLRVVAVPRVS